MFFLLFVFFIIWSRSKYDRQSDRRVFKSLLPMRGRSSWKVFQLKRGNENGRVRTKKESGFFKKSRKIYGFD
jgi:hypothetical protein